MNKSDQDVQFLNIVMDSIQEGILILDTDLKIVKANQWIKTKHYNDEDVTGHYCFKIHKKRTIPCSKCTVIDTIKSKKPQKQVVRNPFNDGPNDFFEINTYPVFDENGEVEFVVEKYQDISELKQSINKLMKSENNLKVILDNSPDLVMITDMNADVVFISENVEKITGYSVEYFKGKGLPKDCIYPEDLPKCQTLVSNLKAGKPLEMLEYRFVKKDGSIIWMQHTVNPIYENGEISVMQNNLRDITAQKQNELALLHSHDLMKYIIEHTRSAVAIHDKNYKYIFVSQSYLKQYNVKEENIIGRHHYEVFPDLPQKWRDVHKKALDGIVSSAEDDPYYRADGKVEWTRWECRPWYEADKSIRGFIVYTEVITDRKNMEIEIIDARDRAEESAKKLQEAHNIAKLGSWEFDVESGLFSFTDSFYKIYHTNAEEMGGYQMTIAQYKENFMHPDDADMVDFETEKALNTDDPGFSSYVEHRVKYKDGGIGYIGVTFFIKKDIEGRTIKTYGVNQDITQKKLTEKQLLEAKHKAEESDRLKSEFINNMSHEIRTPMNGILGFSKLLNRANLSDKKRDYYTQIIVNSGNQLIRIIDDILEISALGTKQVKIEQNELSINDLLAELYAIFQMKAKDKNLPLYLKKDLPDEESVIYTDASKLNKILSNLLENAFKFTNEGSVEFGYKLIKSNAKPMLEIFVKDTGIGIHKDKQTRIFDRFTQEEKEVSKIVGGIGLGLSIAKENAELLGGGIRLESEKGEGAAFYVTIPYSPVRKSE